MSRHNVVKADWAWKQENSTYKKRLKTKEQKRAAKKTRRSVSQQRQENRRKKNEAIRESVQKHFGVHEFTTWAALAELVCRETMSPMPETDKQCRRLVLLWGKGSELVKKKYKPRMTSDQFYSSTKWKELRYIALKNSGGCCSLCGARASDGVTLHVDHIVPRSVEPSREFDLGNLQILCDDCNIGKSNRDCIDWR